MREYAAHPLGSFCSSSLTPPWESPFQTRIVESQGVRDMDIRRLVAPVLPQPATAIRQLRPSRLGAAELLQLALELQNCFRNRRVAFPIHDQAPPALD